MVASCIASTFVLPSSGAGPTAMARLGGAPSIGVACNGAGSPTPSALLVTRPEPSYNLAVGGTLGYQVEVEVNNYTSAMGTVNLTFPTVYFAFPLSNGSTFRITYPHGNLSINSSGWVLLHGKTVVSYPLNFSTTLPSRMTTEKIALMTSGNYGTVTITIRWRWLEIHPHSTYATFGHWSIPEKKSRWPKELPSIFYPAAFVDLVSTSPSPAAIGSNYTMNIAGKYIGGEYMFQELEFPAIGKVVEGTAENVPRYATTFAVEVPLLNYGSYLNPGVYLAHVHDQCGALLYSKSVDAVYAHSANITFYVKPGCAPVTFNGTKYANGSVATVAPGPNPYKVWSPFTCGSLHYNGTILTGALAHVTANKVRVSGNGTLEIRYS